MNTAGFMVPASPSITWIIPFKGTLFTPAEATLSKVCIVFLIIVYPIVFICTQSPSFVGLFRVTTPPIME